MGNYHLIQQEWSMDQGRYVAPADVDTEAWIDMLIDKDFDWDDSEWADPKIGSEPLTLATLDALLDEVRNLRPWEPQHFPPISQKMYDALLTWFEEHAKVSSVAPETPE